MRARFAILTTAAALLTCSGRERTSPIPRPAASPSARSTPVDDSLARAEARKYATAIAENLGRVADPPIVVAPKQEELDNSLVRDRMVRFARAIADGRPGTCDFALGGDRVVVWLYRGGARIGRGEATSAAPCVALKDATRRAVASALPDRPAIDASRVVLELPTGRAVVELGDRGIELTQGLVPTRVLDRSLLRARIADGTQFLLRSFDPERHGVHKFYHATTDAREPELHTVYTASTALTLLKLHAHSKDPRLLASARSALQFVLSMQNRVAGDRARGGFFYSFDLTRRAHDDTIVTGTAAKAIFALLELHALDPDPRYLDAAILAADFLVSMQVPDGSVRSSLQGTPGSPWSIAKKESLLYTGQALSALSRMYRVTKRPRYLDAAARTAVYLRAKTHAGGCYLGDDYRKPNPISSSWVVMSLLDFARATGDAHMEATAIGCADTLVARQRRDGIDIDDGRFGGAMSSSGNGWLAEVISEVNLHCRARGLERCERFRDSVVATTRLLAQYTYSRENAFVAKNPDAAIGGLFWSVRDRYVRTDAVCHAMNAYLNVIEQLGDDPLVTLPERPMAAATAVSAPESPATDDDE